MERVLFRLVIVFRQVRDEAQDPRAGECHVKYACPTRRNRMLMGRCGYRNGARCDAEVVLEVGRGDTARMETRRLEAMRSRQSPWLLHYYKHFTTLSKQQNVET